ncbi:DUF7344 domain-containing protein [Halomarina oriensis]|uniref:DUF7344 domain-containing protein n=1 Tax=Halomarina oriensis TaxID=671145 RepID=A0A6B0GGC7_9EURY|nr:hypothetical protein [Halomarina oriensis]MWG33872.1 hypothetical protein [Halomarina oriensis]
MTSDIHSIDVLALVTPSEGVSPSSSVLDKFYAVLADERRRRLVDHLTRVETTSFERLVGAFAAEHPTRERFSNQLYHVHLPKLSAAGLVEEDAEDIVYDPPASFEAFCDRVRAHSAVDRSESHGVDEGFDILSNARRRAVLRLLDEHHQISLPDVADEVATDEEDVSIVEVDPGAVLDVYLSLYHDHVPRLVDAGLVEYEQERDLVALRTEGTSKTASAVDE